MHRVWLNVLQVCLVALVTYDCDAQEVSDAAWTMWGGNLNNTRSAEASTLISPASISNLTVAWESSVLGAVSASPLLFGGSAVFPTWAGQVYSLNSSTGRILWQSTVDDYISSPLCERPIEYNYTASAVVSRSTPALAGPDVIVIGTQFVVASQLLAGLPYVLGALPFPLAACKMHSLPSLRYY